MPETLVWGAAASVMLLAGGCQGGKRSPNLTAERAAELPQDSQMQTKSSRQTPAAIPGITGPGQQIPPGTCRMVGKVVAILPDRDPNRQAPCGQVPCRALVRVQQVVGYGAAFQVPLVQGQEIKVYFTFTLSPTAKYFPELTNPLPGLLTGSVFEADLGTLPEAGGAGWYQVKAYQVP